MKQVDVVFATYLHSPIGPTGTLRRLLASRAVLLSQGYDLTVYTIDGLNNGEKIQSTPINFQQGLSFRSRLKQLIKRSRVLSALFQLREMCRNRRFVMQYLALEREPDIVVFHEHLAAYYYLKHRKGTKAKTVLFQHSDGQKWTMLLKTYPKLQHTLTLRLMDRQYERVIHAVDRLVFIARMGLENFAKDNPGIPRERLSFFHNGIEMRPHIPLKPGEPKYRLITTGTVDTRKGQHHIIEALGQLPSRKRSAFSLAVLGTGSGVVPFQERAKELGVENIVDFVGRVPNNEVPRHLRKANIYILMSNNEGLPISILEAMREGLPVISTNVAGIPEQVRTNDNGVLINPDASELAEIFMNMERYDWAAMGKRSRERFEQEFTFDQMLEGYVEMLGETIE